METAEALKNTSLFAPLSDNQRKDIMDLGQIVDFKSGEAVFKQGKPANTLYVLLRGSLRLTVQHPDELDLLAETLNEGGAVFGMASMTKSPRYNVTATCKENVTALAIDAKKLQQIIRREPLNGLEVMAELAQLYSNRLNNARSAVNTICRIFASQARKSQLSDVYRELE